MVWDEGNAILRAEGIAQGRWLYTTRLEGHPAFYGMVIAAGRWLSAWCLAGLQAGRFGPMMLFALAAGAMFYRTARDYSAAAAFGATAALICLPRMFAHAHFASIDGPLVSCWVLAWATFPAGGDRTGNRAGRGGYWPAGILWGITLGMTLSCKATGWLAPLPFLLWTAAYRTRPAVWAIGVGLPVALLTFWMLNPPLWHDPLHGWATFMHLNFHRAANAELGLNISILFLGRMYNLDYPLPWYNTIVWTLVTVPIGILLLAGVGVAASLRRCRADSAGMLLVLNFLVLLVVRALPGTPPHDGVRLLLPSFAFLAVLAGVGCGVVFGYAARRWNRRAAAAAVVAVYLTAAGNLVLYAPQWLSYYNLLIGGLGGATAAGMEPTYYWDGLDHSVLDWLHEHTAEGEKIRFGACSPTNLYLMRRWGTLRRETDPGAPGEFRWYVVQRRPSGYSPVDEWLIGHARPAHRKTLLAVPLVEVYRYADYRRAVESASCFSRYR